MGGWGVDGEIKRVTEIDEWQMQEKKVRVKRWTEEKVEMQEGRWTERREGQTMNDRLRGSRRTKERERWKDVWTSQTPVAGQAGRLGGNPCLAWIWLSNRGPLCFLLSTQQGWPQQTDRKTQILTHSPSIHLCLWLFLTHILSLSRTHSLTQAPWSHLLYTHVTEWVATVSVCL